MGRSGEDAAETDVFLQPPMPSKTGTRSRPTAPPGAEHGDHQQPSSLGVAAGSGGVTIPLWLGVAASASRPVLVAPRMGTTDAVDAALLMRLGWIGDAQSDGSISGPVVYLGGDGEPKR